MIKINKLLIDSIYPVGSIYLSVNSTNPSTLFGGTWEQIKDKFLLACGSSYSNGSTGGEATHKLTIDEMPSHQHRQRFVSVYGYEGFMVSNNGGGGEETNSDLGVFPSATASSQRTDKKRTLTDIAGDNQPHNNMPPYLAVYMWKRIK